MPQGKASQPSVHSTSRLVLKRQRSKSPTTDRRAPPLTETSLCTMSPRSEVKRSRRSPSPCPTGVMGNPLEAKDGTVRAYLVEDTSTTTLAGGDCRPGDPHSEASDSDLSGNEGEPSETPLIEHPPNLSTYRSSSSSSSHISGVHDGAPLVITVGSDQGWTGHVEAQGDQVSQSGVSYTDDKPDGDDDMVDDGDSYHDDHHDDARDPSNLSDGDGKGFSEGESDSQDDHSDDESDEHSSDDHSDSDREDHPSDDDEDDYESDLFGRRLTSFMGGNSLFSHMGGSPMNNHYKSLLASIKNDQDPDSQVVALQELAEALSIATEESLAGRFNLDAFSKTLVQLMHKPEIESGRTEEEDDTQYANEYERMLATMYGGGAGGEAAIGGGGSNPTIMLLACRCIFNLIEVTPAALPVLVSHGVVKVLCSKLMDIEYIDLAEQALSTLEKVASEFPAAVVREGGLEAALNYLDFFPLHVQRTAVIIAAHCAHRLPADCLGHAKEAVPTLVRLLDYSDQRVVEQASLALFRIIRSLQNEPDKISELASDPQLLQRLLGFFDTSPDTSDSRSGNTSGSSINNPGIFVRVTQTLTLLARNSAQQVRTLLEFGVVSAVCRVLKAKNPKEGTTSTAGAPEGEQLADLSANDLCNLLSLLSELLPPMPTDSGTVTSDSPPSEITPADTPVAISSQDTPITIPVSTFCTQPVPERLAVYTDHPEYLDQLGRTVLPIMLTLFQSTVNLDVRRRIMALVVKLLYLLDATQVDKWLADLPLAAFLSQGLGQPKAPVCILVATLQILSLLIEKGPPRFLDRLHREGVIYELGKLRTTFQRAVESGTPPKGDADSQTSMEEDGPEMALDVYVTFKQLERTLLPFMDSVDQTTILAALRNPPPTVEPTSESANAPSSSQRESSQGLRRVIFSSSLLASSAVPTPTHPEMASNLVELGKWINAKLTAVQDQFSEARHREDGVENAMEEDGFEQLQLLARLLAHPESDRSRSSSELRGLLERIASRFVSSTGITSFELMESGLPVALGELLTQEVSVWESNLNTRRELFVRVFMSQPTVEASSSGSVPSPFQCLLECVQGLLAHLENLTVETTYQNGPMDGYRSSTSLLAKQIRLRLVPADETLPDSTSESTAAWLTRHFIVSVHAILSFHTLEEYLKPHLFPNEDQSAPGQARAGIRWPFLTGNSATNATEGGSSSSGLANAFAALASMAGLSNVQRVLGTQGVEDRSLTPETVLTTAEDLESNGVTEDEEEPSTEITLPDSRRNTPMKPVASRTRSASRAAESSRNGVSSEVQSPSGGGPSGSHTRTMPTLTKMDSSSPLRQRLVSAPVTLNRKPDTPVRTHSEPGILERDQTESSSQAGNAKVGLAFELEGHLVTDNHATIYSAIHAQIRNQASESAPNPWAVVYTVKYRRVLTDGDHTQTDDESGQVQQASLPTMNEDELADQLPQCESLLDLLKALVAMYHDNRYQKYFTSQKRGGPLQFTNSRFTAKLSRQLDESLLVVSRCLPNWCDYLVTHYPFLFPFDLRHAYLQYTAFGYSRSIIRWQSLHPASGDPSGRNTPSNSLGRVQRQKVRVSRRKVLLSAAKVLELYGSSHTLLEIEYFDEVGTGLGPTLEFYAMVSKELCRRDLGLWRDVTIIASSADTADQPSYVVPTHSGGLFPRPLPQPDSDSRALMVLESTTDALPGLRTLPPHTPKERWQWFEFMGQFVAKSMLDFRIIDLPLHPLFIQLLLGQPVEVTLATLQQVDPTLAQSLQPLQWFVDQKRDIYQDDQLNPEEQKACVNQLRDPHGASVDDLCLDFTLPGYPEIPLRPQGEEVPVTIHNVDDYLTRVICETLDHGIRAQVDYFQRGFNKVFPLSRLGSFTSEELTTLFGAAPEDWSLVALQEGLVADHGYHMASPIVQQLLQVMNEFTVDERRTFLKFITGSPKLPIGGFKHLSPPLTVVCKPCEAPLTPEDYLPSVMTCVNYLKLPNYPTKEVLKERLFTAMQEGQDSFHLS
ncbi:Ubiquitin fusion degradation protein 4 [Dispira simplex]|nr:Ubiquitin fusion degradation protein 4 [Dispira simplex]